MSSFIWYMCIGFGAGFGVEMIGLMYRMVGSALRSF